MDDDTTPDPVPDPPTPDPTPDPPTPEPGPSDDLRNLVSALSEKVDVLSAKVETLAPVDGPRDEVPVSRPWTSRGRR